MNKKLFLLFFALFLISVLIRIPTLNRPLSKHHEFCTAVALRIMQIWDKEGIATCHFDPVMTYPNAADKFINNYASGSGKMADKEGNYYYVSHPPFAYYVPYFLFELIGVCPDVLPIEIFNLLLHFLSALGIYFIIRQLERASAHASWFDSAHHDVAAIAGFTFYLFSVATMWFQSNTYMSDMAVQPLFIYGILFALKFFESGKRKDLLLLTLFVFLMTYTTWLGVFFAATLIFFVLIHRKHLTFSALCVALIFSAAFFGVAITVFQYSQIAGFDAYSTEAFGRFTERSGVQNGIGYFFLLSRTITWNYVTSYLPLLVIVVLFLVGNRFRLHGIFKILPFAVIPVLLLHLVFPNYSGHDFVSLYEWFFLSVVAGIGSQFLFKKGKWILTASLALYVLISTGHYYYVNRPGEISQRGDRYADFKDIGTSIKQLSTPDEVVFLLNEKPSPEVIFYAERNILQVTNEEETRQHLMFVHVSKGVIFKKSGNDRVEVVKRIQM